MDTFEKYMTDIHYMVQNHKITDQLKLFGFYLSNAYIRAGENDYLITRTEYNEKRIEIKISQETDEEGVWTYTKFAIVIEPNDDGVDVITYTVRPDERHSESGSITSPEDYFNISISNDTFITYKNLMFLYDLYKDFDRDIIIYYGHKEELKYGYTE